MRIRCQYLGLSAALALALSVSAAEWSSARSVPAAASGVPQIQTSNAADEASPMPAPVLFVAGGLLAVAAMVRWRQRFRP